MKHWCIVTHGVFQRKRKIYCLITGMIESYSLFLSVQQEPWRRNCILLDRGEWRWKKQRGRIFPELVLCFAFVACFWKYFFFQLSVMSKLTLYQSALMLAVHEARSLISYSIFLPSSLVVGDDIKWGSLHIVRDMYQSWSSAFLVVGDSSESQV